MTTHRRVVFFISDGTGITVEGLGHSLLTQFQSAEFESTTIPYVDSPEKAHQALQRIEKATQTRLQRPIIISSLVDSDIREILQSSEALFIDVFQTFIPQLEEALQQTSTTAIGRSHGLVDEQSYAARIDAVNYALTTDDGTNPRQYENADMILIGVSRSGKTPTSLYLALQFGVYCANYPFTEDDLSRTQLPESLQAHKNKLFGLTIDPKQLHNIRTARRPNSQYASLTQCRKELQIIEALFKQLHIPHINTTARSIEEIATQILAIKQVKRHLV